MIVKNKETIESTIRRLEAILETERGLYLYDQRDMRLAIAILKAVLRRHTSKEILKELGYEDSK